MFGKVLPEKAEAQKVEAVQQRPQPGEECQLRDGGYEESPTNGNVCQVRGQLSLYARLPKLTHTPPFPKKTACIFSFRELEYLSVPESPPLSPLVSFSLKSILSNIYTYFPLGSFCLEYLFPSFYPHAISILGGEVCFLDAAETDGSWSLIQSVKLCLLIGKLRLLILRIINEKCSCLFFYYGIDFPFF